MDKHTPGPWVYEFVGPEDDESLYIGPLDEETGRPAHTIFEGGCTHGWEGDGDPEADARLMAAAPELLDALQKIIEEFNPKRPEWHLMVSSEGQRMARAAIAKALGQPL
jgi:hypothetical protein